MEADVRRSIGQNLIHASPAVDNIRAAASGKVGLVALVAQERIVALFAEHLAGAKAVFHQIVSRSAEGDVIAVAALDRVVSAAAGKVIVVLIALDQIGSAISRDRIL